MEFYVKVVSVLHVRSFRDIYIICLLEKLQLFGLSVFHVD